MEEINISRQRSPGYPVISLEMAIERAERIYNEDGKAGSTRESIFSHLGYGGDSGSSRRMLAALRKYGLLEGEGNKIYLSNDAIVIIIQDTNSIERREAIKRCALNPKLYNDLWNQYKDTGLPSNKTLKTKLITEMKFNAKKVDQFISDFRDTIEFAGLQNDIASTEDIIKGKTNEYGNRQESASFVESNGLAKKSNAIIREYPIPRKKQKLAVLKLEHPISGKEIEVLIQWLEFMKDTLAEED